VAGFRPSAASPSPSPDRLIAARPIGAVIDTSTTSTGLATATFSADRAYRYRLSRVWDPSLARVNFLMLNPSTADAFQLDPTVRRCIGFARAWGMGSVEVTNAYAYRAAHPKLLKLADNPIGDGDDDACVAAATVADLVIVAWGVHATRLDRQGQMLQLLASAAVVPHYLTLTRSGHPGHPLYLPGTTIPPIWD